jgi:hypothetical protein
MSRLCMFRLCVPLVRTGERCAGRNNGGRHDNNRFQFILPMVF